MATTMKKRLGSAKDLGSVKRWSNAFLQYISIIAAFRKHDISVLPALLDFHARIVKLDDSYQWEAVVLLALKFHRQKIIFGFNDPKAWKLQPYEIFDACNHAPKEKKPAASNSAYNSKGKFGDQICINWNTKGCSYSTCQRQHVCLICKASHTKENHTDGKVEADQRSKK